MEQRGVGHAMVVYDTVFLGTRLIAEQVAEAVGESMAVDLVHIDDVPEYVPEDCTLLVLGVPHSPGRKVTDGGEHPGGSNAVYAWLESMPVAPSNALVAVFETHHQRWGRHVAEAERVLRLLTFRGCVWKAAPQSFKLPEGEDPPAELLEHARGWGEALVVLAEAQRPI